MLVGKTFLWPPRIGGKRRAEVRARKHLTATHGANAQHAIVLDRPFIGHPRQRQRRGSGDTGKYMHEVSGVFLELGHRVGDKIP